MVRRNQKNILISWLKLLILDNIQEWLLNCTSSLITHGPVDEWRGPEFFII